MSRTTRHSHDATETLTAATVPIPAAVPVLQRTPEPEHSYRLRTRLADWWHGLRDRRRVAKPVYDVRKQGLEKEGQSFATDFLMRLTAECHTRQEIERRTTRVAIAVLDNTIVAARRNQQILADRLPDIDLRLRELTETEAGDAPTTSAEQYDTPAQRRARRARTHRAQIDALQAERQDAVRGIDAARRTIDSALEARRAHWDQLLVRAELLNAHYNRRSRTYARAATRRSRALSSSRGQLITGPEWTTAEALPAEPIIRT